MGKAREYCRKRTATRPFLPVHGRRGLRGQGEDRVMHVGDADMLDSSSEPAAGGTVDAKALQAERDGYL